MEGLIFGILRYQRALPWRKYRENMYKTVTLRSDQPTA